MFLAIINDTYAEVKAEVMKRKADFEVGDFLKTGVNNVKGYLGIHDRYISFKILPDPFQRVRVISSRDTSSQDISSRTTFRPEQFSTG